MGPWAWLFAYLGVVIAVNVVVKVAGDELPWQLALPFIIGAALQLIVPGSALAGLGFAVSLIVTIMSWRVRQRWRRLRRERDYLCKVGTLP